MENGWKKMVPRYVMFKQMSMKTRALFAAKGTARATATWAVEKPVRCLSASHHLRWMRKMTDPQKAKQMLQEYGFEWHWIKPTFVRDRDAHQSTVAAGIRQPTPHGVPPYSGRIHPSLDDRNRGSALLPPKTHALDATVTNRSLT